MSELDGEDRVETEYLGEKLPRCQIPLAHPEGSPEAVYDGRTRGGPWAYMCEACFGEYGRGLGLGKGQRLALRKPGRA